MYITETIVFPVVYSGTRIKTRKRNIAVPLDTATFADAIVQIYNEHKGDLVCGTLMINLVVYYAVSFSVVLTMTKL